MHQKEFHIGPSDVDKYLDLRLSCLFKFMQDAATEHAEMLGIGKAVTLDKGLYWVITRYSVDIIRTPKFLETLVVKTYPGRDLKFIFPRLFQIETKDGEIVARASSTWVVLNKNDHNINMKPFNGVTTPHEHIDGEEPMPARVNAPELTRVYAREARYSDTDLNGHINNTSYINYLVDCHDIEFYKDKQIKHITINYEHELQCGEEIEISNKIEQNREFIGGKSGKNQIFISEIVYRERK